MLPRYKYSRVPAQLPLVYETGSKDSFVRASARQAGRVQVEHDARIIEGQTSSPNSVEGFPQSWCSLPVMLGKHRHAAFSEALRLVVERFEVDLGAAVARAHAFHSEE